MGRQLTDKQIEERTSEKSGDTLQFIGYVDARGKDQLGRFRHSCGAEFSRAVGNVIYGGVVSCPECNPDKFGRTLDGVTNRVKASGFELVTSTGLRCGDWATVKFQCGCLQTHTIGSLLSKNPPKCMSHTEGYRAHVKREDFEKELKSLPYGSFSLVGSFVNKSNPFRVVCDRCDHEVEVANFGVLTSRKGKCFSCGGTVKSVKEEFVAVVLSDLGVKFVREKVIGRYRYDFELPDHGVLIEYDGEQHTTGNWRGIPIQLNDSEKDHTAEAEGYRLLRISHTDSVIHSVLEFLKVQRPS